ncbi:mannose-6-phosphate receptor binding domain-containing protein [Infundibulicybe gibba]|nr:mannose-6-phosphate receptor binding domain-containing protein [Infundibulicybe gibba]
MFWPNICHFLLLAGLGGLRTVAAEEKPCTIHDNGVYYDLNPLKSKKDYNVQAPDSPLFVINVCAGVTQDTFNMPEDYDQIGGFVRRAHGDFSIGKINTTLSMYDSRPRMVLTDGSVCKTPTGKGDTRASTVVEFICDTSVYNAGKPKLVLQMPPGDSEYACDFFIEWRTHLACPRGEGGPWGFFAVLAILRFVGFLMLYAVLGTLYNRYVLQLRGFDQIPQFSIESMKYHGSEAWGWLQDVITGLSTGREYSSGHLATNGSRGAPNPVSHHSQSGDVGSEFTRPQNGARTGFSGDARTNPVSHQSQVIQQPQSPLPPSPPPKSSPPPAAASTNKQEFALVGDEEMEGQELGIIDSTPILSAPEREGEDPISLSGTTPAVALAAGKTVEDEGNIRL